MRLNGLWDKYFLQDTAILSMHPTYCRYVHLSICLSVHSATYLTNIGDSCSSLLAAGSNSVGWRAGCFTWRLFWGPPRCPVGLELPHARKGKVLLGVGWWSWNLGARDAATGEQPFGSLAYWLGIMRQAAKLGYNPGAWPSGRFLKGVWVQRELRILPHVLWLCRPALEVLSAHPGWTLGAEISLEMKDTAGLYYDPISAPVCIFWVASLLRTPLFLFHHHCFDRLSLQGLWKSSCRGELQAQRHQPFPLNVSQGAPRERWPRVENHSSDKSNLPLSSAQHSEALEPPHYDLMNNKTMSERWQNEYAVFPSWIKTGGQIREVGLLWLLVRAMTSSYVLLMLAKLRSSSIPGACNAQGSGICSLVCAVFQIHQSFL